MNEHAYSDQWDVDETYDGELLRPSEATFDLAWQTILDWKSSLAKGEVGGHRLKRRLLPGS